MTKDILSQEERISRLGTDTAWEYCQELNALAGLFIDAAENARDIHLHPMEDRFDANIPPFTVQEDITLSFEESSRVDESQLPMLIAVLEVATEALRQKQESHRQYEIRREIAAPLKAEMRSASKKLTS